MASAKRPNVHDCETEFDDEDPEGYRVYGLGEWGELGGLILPNYRVEAFSCEETSQTIVRLPRAAAASPRAIETVDFPTPPLPVTKTSRLSSRSGTRIPGGFFQGGEGNRRRPAKCARR